jgi:hypothetical protein
MLMTFFRTATITDVVVSACLFVLASATFFQAGLGNIGFGLAIVAGVSYVAAFLMYLSPKN